MARTLFALSWISTTARGRFPSFDKVNAFTMTFAGKVLSLGVSLLVFGGVAAAQASATITVQNAVAGTTPEAIGYNLGHFMESSNAADWWRYNGFKGARAFISVSDIEPSDDISPTGDGVNSSASFFARRAALRANAANPGTALDPQYVNWSYFANNYQNSLGSNNRFKIGFAFPQLRAQGVEILANITASPSRFPLSGDTDWANKWELWQHFYAQAFYLSSNYDVRRFGMFNEPNAWTPSITAADWLRRLSVCSDAIQSAVADVNARYGKTLNAQIFAPNTANGSTKYLEWGQPAVLNRHLRLDGTVDPNWLNLHIYNYQKYSMYTNDTGSSSGYIEDIVSLQSYVAGDMAGETPFSRALTEFNVRTGANYDTVIETLDSPSDFTALGANSVALTQNAAKQLYYFKFAQTERTGGTYPVAKNGTHYADNTTSGVNNYGSATKGAEVARLFNKAARGGRNRFSFTSNAGTEVWPLVTFDAATNTYFVFLSNKSQNNLALTLNVSALGVPSGNRAVVEEVSASYSGGVSGVVSVSNGIVALTVPARSVQLVSIPCTAQSMSTVDASADAVLGDGTGKSLPGGTATRLLARADGQVDGRRVSLIKFSTAGIDPNTVQRVLLTLNAGTISQNVTAQAHIYGLQSDSWSEDTVTWSTLTSALKQNVTSGNTIAKNIVANPGTETQILGQLVTTASAGSQKMADVTDFVKSQTDGAASFLIVQDHRWNVAIPALTNGDTQPDGVAVDSKESANKPKLTILSNLSATAPTINSQPTSRTVTVGQPTTFTVSAAGTDPLSYQWAFNGNAIAGAMGANYTISSVQVVNAGFYTVTVTNSYGGVTSDAAVLTVNQPPTAVASATPVSGTAPLTVNFTGSNSTDPENGALTYSWNFGNGSTASVANATATYSSAGTYTATLTVRDAAGASSTASVVISVAAATQSVFVKAMTIALNTTSKGTTATVTITVWDNKQAPRPSATVTGSWTGLTSGNTSGTTNQQGVVTFTSARTKTRGTFTYTVKGISATGYTYSPSNNSATTVSISW